MVWRLLKKSGIKPPYDQAIPLRGIYPEETKIEKDTCTPLFTAPLFTIARTWKQPRCPLTDEWIKLFDHFKVCSSVLCKFGLNKDTFNCNIQFKLP